MSGRLTGMLGGALCLFACDTAGRFDTGADGAFCGAIVDGSFVRKGFDPATQMRLTLDSAQFDSFPGRISTDDAGTGACGDEAEFENTTLRTIQEALEDPLSALRFGDAQEENILAWVDSRCRGTMLAVISLLRDGRVELRLLRPVPSSGGEADTAFGVFILERTDCTL